MNHDFGGMWKEAVLYLTKHGKLYFIKGLINPLLKQD